MVGNTAQYEEIGREVDHIDRFEFAIDTDRQAFTGERVDDIEHAVLAAIMSAILDEVVAPDVVGTL
jgi:hypothetical protein